MRFRSLVCIFKAVQKICWLERNAACVSQKQMPRSTTASTGPKKRVSSNLAAQEQIVRGFLMTERPRKSFGHYEVSAFYLKFLRSGHRHFLNFLDRTYYCVHLCAARRTHGLQQAS